MTVFFEPSVPSGTVKAPPSKSMAHRFLFCAGLSRGDSTIENVAFSNDILATVRCLRACGASFMMQNNGMAVRGTDVKTMAPTGVLDCGECGTTLRFVLPLCMLCGETVTLTGSGRLLQRPLSVYEQLCREKNIDFGPTETGISVRGRLAGGIYSVPGDVSSQFISGLLFALPLLEADSEIRISGELQSRPYVEMTVAALKKAGIHVFWKDRCTLAVPGGQNYSPINETVEGDWSNAAFFLAFHACGYDVNVPGLKRECLQGDRVCLDYFERMKNGCPTVDLRDCPDLGPIFMAFAAVHHGAIFIGTRRLSIKESDRGAVMAAELEKFGVRTDVYEDEIHVHAATSRHMPQMPVFGHNDHRIVMSLSFLLAQTGGTLVGAEAVKKSWPDYYQILQQLKVKIHYEA